MTPRSRRVLVTLAAVAGIALTGRLGVWQLDRAAQKNALQAMLEERRALPPLSPGELARTEVDAARQHFRAVVVEGRWLGEHTVYLDNRPMDGHAGFFVVTPMMLADGAVVAVQRGWLPRDAADRTHVAAPPLPAGPQRVAGHIAPPPSRLFEFAGAGSGSIRQNLDLGAYAAEVGRPLLPLAIVQDDGPLTPADGLRRDWPRPAVDVQMHYGYAFQWFAMAITIAALYAWFQLIRPRLRH